MDDSRTGAPRTAADRPVTPVRVEVLLVEDCPSRAAAVALVEEAAQRSGVEVAVVETVLRTREEALARGFTGSPTVLVDGADVDPPHPAQPAAIACRVYRTATGTAVVPDRARLERALRAAAA